METGKPGLENTLTHISFVEAQMEKRMDAQAPLSAVYIHTVPALPVQPYPHVAMPPLYSKETLPFLTLHLGLQSQPGLALAAAVPPAASRPKASGKHVCPHCGRDCLKPSVLEKHVRCHTGERPYPCTTCGVSFKTQSNLYKHKRTQAHARLSSESEKSSMGSLDSMSGSRETCTSSSSLDEPNQESTSMEEEATSHGTSCPAGPTAKANSVKTQGSVSRRSDVILTGHNAHPKEIAMATLEVEKPPVSASRHLPIQRQEATLFSKQWESSMCRGISQSHESTDSGFSESSDHYPSLGSVLHDPSMDSLSEPTMAAQTPSEPGQGGPEPKDNTREQRTLEERITKLISENTAVVEDKKLEKVRPRKTVLSKQGSIDLPMPYTYKDSFHFDMRLGKTPNVGLQRTMKPGFYNSVPTPNSMEHAPLTRSNSLPFSVTLLQPERSSPMASRHTDYVSLVRSGSSGHINPTGFVIKPVSQQPSTHRPLVRQAAIDNHTTDALSTHSSVEEAYAGGLSCDGDGSDMCAEASNRKSRRKKSQKFAYNKWYTYGGGMFKKLYDAEKAAGSDGAVKGRKSSKNTELGVHQEQPQGPGLQKRLSAGQKDTVTSTGSTITFTTSSCAPVFHPGGPSTKEDLFSAADFNLKASQFHASSSSPRAPLRRNKSLSVLPFPSTGALVNQEVESAGRAEAGRWIDDSSSRVCVAQVPSNRKKQKTDGKVMCSQEMETDQSALTHPLPSVPGSVPQKDANLSCIHLEEKLKHDTLKGSLFLPCIINANTPSVSTLLATSTPASAKTSFLPKYQLKLPNAAVPDSNPSDNVEGKPTVTDGCCLASAPLSCHIQQTSPSATISEKECSDTVTPPLKQSCHIKKTDTYSSTHCILPGVDTSTLNKSNKETSAAGVMHRQFAETTKTTTFLPDSQAGLCSTPIQHSKCVECPMPLQIPTPATLPVPATPSLTTSTNQTSASIITACSQGGPNSDPPALSHTQLLLAPAQMSLANRAHCVSNRPSVPCPVVPFDQMQPAAQKVFHVHTADLQICLQIISDEQLALIEPQIERHAGGALSQRSGVEEVIDNKAQSPVTMRSGNEGRDQTGMQDDVDPSESLTLLDIDKTKPRMSVQLGKEELDLHWTDHSNPTTVSVGWKPPEALGSSQCPHQYRQVNMVTATLGSTGHVMSTEASLKCAELGLSQPSGDGHALSLNHCAEEQLLQDMRVSQGGLVSETIFGQHQPHVSSLSLSTVNQNSTTGEILGKESQGKLNYQGALCDVSTGKANSEAFACKSSREESSEGHPPPQAGLRCQGLSSYSTNEHKTQGKLNQQTSIYCGITETPESSRNANVRCGWVGPVEDLASSREKNLSESQDVIISTHTDKQLGHFTSGPSNLQVDRATDIPAERTTIQSPTAGPVVGCAAQKELQIWGHEETIHQHAGEAGGESIHQHTEEARGESIHQHTEEARGESIHQHTEARGESIHQHTEEARGESIHQHTEEARGESIHQHTEEAGGESIHQHTEARGESIHQHTEEARGESIHQHTEEAGGESIHQHTEEAGGESIHQHTEEAGGESILQHTEARGESIHQHTEAGGESIHQHTEAGGESIHQHTEEAGGESIHQHTEEAGGESIHQHTEAGGESIHQHTGEARGESIHQHTEEARGESIHQHTEEAGGESIHQHTEAGGESIHQHTEEAGGESIHQHTEEAGGESIHQHTEAGGESIHQHTEEAGGESIHQHTDEAGGESIHHHTGGRGDGGQDEEPGRRGPAESTHRNTLLQHMTKPKGGDRKVEVASLTSPSSAQTGFFSSPQPLMDNCFHSQHLLHQEGGIDHNQSTQILCVSDSIQHLETQAQLTGSQLFASSQIEYGSEQTLVTFQGQTQTNSILTTTPCAQQDVANVQGSCAQLAWGSHTGLCLSTHFGQTVSYCVQVSRATDTGLTGSSNDNVVDNNSPLPSEIFTYPGCYGYQDTKDTASSSSISEGPDMTNSQSYLFPGCQTPAQGQTGGVRPVQSCVDYPEDTSSSDDEGKLIIEL